MSFGVPCRKRYVVHLMSFRTHLFHFVSHRARQLHKNQFSDFPRVRSNLHGRSSEILDAEVLLRSTSLIRRCPSSILGPSKNRSGSAQFPYNIEFF
ncbi:hypothetical protein O6P43_024131 [Quillaja saponaria]|uniref:Uncharacterized protein n=1 Tax=Quillaja saponaria TaxID=32244 RepID=A0AAD7L611_QUISA|nr:hypothetical protein O6P43_024131 [Quillaja saponaria]